MIKRDPYTVKVKVVFEEHVNEPIVALSIKDRMGVEITGTNTMFEKIATGENEKGDILTVTFTQDMFLQGGEYLVSLGLVGYREGDFTVYHRLYDIFSIQVISSKDTVGYYDMDSKVSIERSHE